jgi:2,3-bisphosphoglycerate-dependent phosphoglycerate mutase
VLGLRVRVREDLRERLLSPGHLDDWEEHCRRGWRDFDARLPGGESSRTAQRRVGEALDRIAADHRGQTVAVASHGNLIALALHRHDPSIGFEFWRSMPMPAVYPLDLPG